MLWHYINLFLFELLMFLVFLECRPADCSVFSWLCLALCVCDEQLVGLAAKQHMMKNPANSVSGIKRFMGCTANDDVLENSGPVKVENHCSHSFSDVQFREVLSSSMSDESVPLNFVALCCVGNSRWWIADVQCDIQAEAYAVEPCRYCYHFVQKNDGLVHHLTYCCFWLKDTYVCVYHANCLVFLCEFFGTYFKLDLCPSEFMETCYVVWCYWTDIAESHGGAAECHDAVLSVPLSFSETQHAATRWVSLCTVWCVNVVKRWMVNQLPWLTQPGQPYVGRYIEYRYWQ